MREQAFLNGGINIVLRDERPEEPLESDLIYEGGIRSFVEYMNELEREGRAIIIRPTKHISKFEKDSARLREYYKNGYDAAKLRMKDIKSFITGR